MLAAVEVAVEVEQVRLEQLLGGSKVGRTPRLATPGMLACRRPA